MNEKGHWRWNRNITWHYFCSVGSSAAMAREAENEFTMYHNLRTLLYFSVCTIESALNAAMREHMRMQPEETLLARLRKSELKKKIKDWPSEIAGKEINFENDFWKFIEQYKYVRDEITHPKLKDHSVYIHLDKADPTMIEKAIARALVTLHMAQKKAWPYWLLSWNYVGMNGDPTFPLEINNLNGFYHSLPALGIRYCGGGQMSFEEKGMSTLEHFDELDAVMRKVKVDIEPPHTIFNKPRLTRRWWDQGFLLKQFGHL